MLDFRLITLLTLVMSCVYISHCCWAMIVHGVVFGDLMVISVIPIPKGKNINCTSRPTIAA